MVRVDLRTVDAAGAAAGHHHKDNVPVRVTAVVVLPGRRRARRSSQVENYLVAHVARSRRRRCARCSASTCSTSCSPERDKINEILQEIIDQQTEPWGVKVSVVEVKDVELPTSMQRAMARQAEAERERRAKIIGAEGEFQASEKLAQAAQVIARTRSRCSCATCRRCTRSRSTSNSTTILPIPIDLLRPFAEAAQRYADGGGAPLPPAPVPPTRPAPPARPDPTTPTATSD